MSSKALKRVAIIGPALRGAPHRSARSRIDATAERASRERGPRARNGRALGQARECLQASGHLRRKLGPTRRRASLSPVRLPVRPVVAPRGDREATAWTRERDRDLVPRPIPRRPRVGIHRRRFRRRREWLFVPLRGVRGNRAGLRRARLRSRALGQGDAPDREQRVGRDHAHA